MLRYNTSDNITGRGCSTKRNSYKPCETHSYGLTTVLTISVMSWIILFRKQSLENLWQTFNNHRLLFQETFCFCARQRCNSSNSPPSPNPLLSLLAFLCYFSNWPSSSPNQLSFLLLVFFSCTLPSPCILLVPPLFLIDDLGNSVRDLQSTIFNIPPWRSFNISPTGRNFRRLSELRRRRARVSRYLTSIQIIINFLPVFVSNDQGYFFIGLS